MAHVFVNLRDFAPHPSFVSTRGDRVLLSAVLWGGRPHESVELCCAAAYELGRELVDHAEGLVAAIERPPYDWRAAPERPTPPSGSGR